MACEVCEHCQTPFSKEEAIAVRGGFSYHRKCHKCYVCSETNLHNAELFNGVIFCSSCAQRIFQGCSTARRNKNTRQKRSPTRCIRRRIRTRAADRKPEQNRTGVIELARLAVSSDSSKSSEDPKIKDTSSKALAVSTELALQVGKEINRSGKSLKKDSTEMGMTTNVTQELLKQINCPVITTCQYKPFQKPKHRIRCKRNENKNNVCSDLRIAELGASTEIANMALRKKSEMPVIIKSESRFKQSESFTMSMINQESDNMYGDAQDWMNTPHSTISDFIKRRWMDRRIGSILKLPYKSFKKNILNRSSLVSDLMSRDDDRFSLLKKLKLLFYEEIAEHQDRGLRKLYPSINRKTVPYKLGWLELVSKVSQVMKCKHFKRSHSYRCMRSHVMRLAGPTKSELALFRNKVKRFIAPRFLKRIIALDRQQRAITATQACGASQ